MGRGHADRPASLILGIRVNIWTSIIALVVALTIVVVRQAPPEDDEPPSGDVADDGADGDARTDTATGVGDAELTAVEAGGADEAPAPDDDAGAEP